MKYITNYLTIIKLTGTQEDEVGNLIYALAFNELKKMGLVEEYNGRLAVLDGGMAYYENSIKIPEAGTEVIETEFVKAEKEVPVVATPSVSVEDEFDEDEVEDVDFAKPQEEEEIVFTNRQELEDESPRAELESEESVVEDENEQVVTTTNVDNFVPNFTNLLIEEDKDEQGGVFEDNPFDSQEDEADNPFGGEDFADDNPFANDEDEDVVISEEVETEEISEDPIQEQEEEEEEKTFDFDFFAEDVTEENNVEATEETDDLEMELTQDDLPPQEMPEYMETTDFSFALKNFKYEDKAENVSEMVKFFVAPFRTDVENPASLVKITIDGEIYHTTTDNEGALTINGGRFVYRIQTKMENGEFDFDVTLEGDNQEKVTVATHKNAGSKGHILLSDDEEGIAIHIFPSNFLNNQFGKANFVYCIDVGEGLDNYFIAESIDEDVALFDIGDDTFALQGRWNEEDGIKTLYMHIEPYQDV